MAPRPVLLFPTCLLDFFDADTVDDVRATLALSGCAVGTAPEAVCCGQPAFNMGHWDEARLVVDHAASHLDATEGPIVVPSGSCAAMMRHHWAALYEDEATTHEGRTRSERVAARVIEWSRFMTSQTDALDRLAMAPRPGGDETFTVHPACHGLRELGIDGDADRLLDASGRTVVPLPQADTCCGFGGAFSVKEPEVSSAMLSSKLDQIAKSGASDVACIDKGCLLHMAGGADKRRAEVPAPRFHHPASIIRAALEQTATKGDP